MESTTTRRQFKPGDICRVRDWDDMAAEFNPCAKTSIGIPDSPPFVDGMRYLCGKTFVIREIYHSWMWNCELYRAEGGVDDSWYISAPMLELVTPSEEEDLEFTLDLSILGL